MSGYVIQDGSRALIENPDYFGTLPTWFRDLPADCVEVATIRGVQLDIYERFDPRIFLCGAD